MLKWGYAIKAASAGAAISACLGALPAGAADMPFYAGDPTPQTKVEFGAGWYIRGDTAWVFENGPVVSPDISTVSTNTQNNFMVDLGGGYKFNNWFRADSTLAYYGTQPVTFGGAPYASSIPYVGTELKKYLLLVNGYVDLGTWYGVTPFVGAGVGGDMINDVTSISTNFTSMTNKYNFAWAVMAGLAYNLTENAAIEAGYRYVSFGNFAGSNAATGSYFSKNMTSQELRIGIRYLVD